MKKQAYYLSRKRREKGGGGWAEVEGHDVTQKKLIQPIFLNIGPIQLDHHFQILNKYTGKVSYQKQHLLRFYDHSNFSMW